MRFLQFLSVVAVSWSATALAAPRTLKEVDDALTVANAAMSADGAALKAAQAAEQAAKTSKIQSDMDVASKKVSDATKAVGESIAKVETLKKERASLDLSGANISAEKTQALEKLTAAKENLEQKKKAYVSSFAELTASEAKKSSDEEVKAMRALRDVAKEEERIAEAAVASAQKAIEDLDAKTLAAAKAAKTEAEEQAQIHEFERGTRLQYGLSLSLLQVRAQRPDDESGRFRDYRGKFELVTPSVGFHFIVQPPGAPWRRALKAKGESYQLMSWGGFFMARLSSEALAQGALSLGVAMHFFRNTIGVGVGFDLYRGVPIQDATGKAGGDTAYTGLASWALAKNGEVTPENVFFVVTLGLDSLVKAVSGTVGEPK